MKQGLGVAAISYDSVALLHDFATRKGISYPLLSDAESKTIRAFGILNDNFPSGHPWHGVPYPGTYIVDSQGIVSAKFFEEDHRERYTASYILVHRFGENGKEETTVETSHLKLSYSASDPVVRGGGRVVLVLQVELKPGMHVYAPGVEGGYIPIDWKQPESPAWLVFPASYPPSRRLHLKAIGETVPVYQGRFRVIRDLTIGQDREIAPFLVDGKITVEGSFRYQACDDKICYPPQTVPLKWRFRAERHDVQRSPAALQREKPAGK